MVPEDQPISPQLAYYRRMTPEQKAAQVERNRARKAARTPEQVERDRRRANEAGAAWKARNPERAKLLRDRALKKRHADPEKRQRDLLGKLKTRAKQRGIEFDLTLDDIIIPERCPVLGIPLAFTVGEGLKGMANEAAPSVDRFDNSRGYVKGNVRVISNRANLLKGSASLAEMERIVA